MLESLMPSILPRAARRPALFPSLARGAALLLLLFSAGALPAQERVQERVGGVPRETARELIALWNAPTTRRVTGDFTLAAGDTVRGDLAIMGGSSRLGGTVAGRVVVINGDLRLLPGGRIDRDLTVVGGEFEHDAVLPDIGGETRVWSARVRYREDGDTLVVDERDALARFGRWRRDRDRDESTRSDLLITTAHTYNRVEGLPLYVGPRFRARTGDTRFTGELFGIFRTGDGLVWKRENLGHAARFEVRQGRRAGVAVGARFYDEVDAVEKWQLTSGEVGLASFVFSRDYRDYWGRHGGLGYVSLFGRGTTELRASVGEERWSARRARDVPSLIDNDVPWRVNPDTDEGVMRMYTLSGTLDTRNNAKDPRSGWLLYGDVERGDGTLDRIATTTAGVRSQAPGDIQYTRAFLDLRRYNRLGPAAQLNLRVVAGGWLDGDPLPLQRRFSVSGVDALPGFDFRRVRNAEADVGTCATGGDAEYAALGRPAQCERMLLLQAEWKGQFRVNLFGSEDNLGDRRFVADRFSVDGTWVVFTNSGRGWLLGDRGTLGAGDGRIPDTGTWRTDIGGGIDLGVIGLYVAQPVSEGGLKPQFFVRLRHRF